jgi:hypothetical protein
MVLMRLLLIAAQIMTQHSLCHAEIQLTTVVLYRNTESSATTKDILNFIQCNTPLA